MTAHVHCRTATEANLMINCRHTRITHQQYQQT